MRGYNDDLVMAFSIALWVRDTAMRLRQEGLDLTKRTLDYYSKNEGIYTNRDSQLKDAGWTQKVGNETEDLVWLL